MFKFKFKCEEPGCQKEVEATDFNGGDAVEEEDWDELVLKFEYYKTLAGVINDSVSHLLECLSSEVYSVIFSTHGREVSNQTEVNLLKNIKRLEVREKNTMASVMDVLGMNQDSDQAILNYIAKLRAAARHCDFRVGCGCVKDISFTDKIILYKLVAEVTEVTDMKLHLACCKAPQQSNCDLKS